MHGFLSDLHWVMLQCTYLLHTVFIPYMVSHNWVDVKNLPVEDFATPCRVLGFSSYNLMNVF